MTSQLQDSGVADPDTVLDQVLDETECPARQLVDDRWVWLPTVLAGRVFTHRVGADEAVHDMLTVTPNLDPITALCEHEQYGRLADGSVARVVLAGFDHELLEQRGIPAEVVDPLGALLLVPGALGAMGVVEGDLVGVRLTAHGLVVERITALTSRTRRVRFRRLRFERGCAARAGRYDLDSDDAFALYTLVNLYDQMSLALIDAADADHRWRMRLPQPANATRTRRTVRTCWSTR